MAVWYDDDLNDVEALVSKVTVDLSAHGIALLERVASEIGASSPALLAEHLETVLADELAYIEALKAGLADIEAGRVVSQADLEAEVFARFGRPTAGA